MKQQLSTAAYAVSQLSAQQGVSVQRSQAFEVLAALLGYDTYAALKVEEADTALDYHLQDAEVYVLNVHAALDRVKGLKLSPAIADFGIHALTSAVSQPVFVDVDSFYEGHVREYLEDAVSGGENVSAAMAESNASFPYSPDLDDWEQSDDLWKSRDAWSIEASGTMEGEYDPDGDRMFNGDTLNVWGKATYAKAGRAGLVFLAIDEGGSMDDSWRDDDAM